MALYRRPYSSSPYSSTEQMPDQGYTPYPGETPQQTPPTPPPAPPDPWQGPAPQEPAPPAPKKYAAIQGFDTGKLNGSTPYDSADKYSDAVRAFSNYLGEGGQVGRNSLSSLTDWLHSHGFAKASGVGDDKVDFGDGQGPIDIINSKGEIWFQNGADRFGDTGGQAGGGGGQPTSTLTFPGGFGGGGNFGGSGSSSWNSGPSQAAMSTDFLGKLKELIGNNGAFNQGSANARIDVARGALERQKKSSLANQRATLAERGLLGSGPERTNLGMIDQDIADQFQGAVTGITADESDRADSRLMQALQMATGMSEEEARNAVSMAGIGSNERVGMANAGNAATRNANDFFLGNKNADNQFTLGQGGLANESTRNNQQYRLGQGQLGLGRDQLLQNGNNQSYDQMLRLLELWMQGSGQSGTGHY